jgi:SAM-dependent methyltransferase
MNCNFCQTDEKIFIQDRICPNCYSLPRDRTALDIIKQWNLLSEDIRVLSVAPNDCFTDLFSNYSNIKHITTNLTGNVTIHMDIQDILFKDNVFSLIICSHVLEHVDNDKKALKELSRVLHPGGLCIIQVPIDTDRKHTFEDKSIKSKRDRKKNFGQDDHVRIYGIDFQNKLRNYFVPGDIYPTEINDFTFVCRKQLK